MIKFNEITWYSKLAAIIFFVGVLPLLSFYIGTKYQETKIINETGVEEIISNSSTLTSAEEFQLPRECMSFFESPKVEMGDFVVLPIECTFIIYKYEGKWKFKINQISETEAQVEILNGENPVQKISIKNYLSYSWPSEMVEDRMGDAQFNIGDDYNFDGYKDIRVTSEIGASNIFFDYWIFNPKTEKFERDPVLTNVANPVFKGKTITSTVLQGASAYTVTTYEFSNGTYVLSSQQRFENNN